MPTPVVINGTTFRIASQGDPAPFGDDLHDLLVEITSVITTLSGSSDILNTTFNLANNQVSAANITGLSFNTASVRAAVVTYAIYRNTSTTEYAEIGNLYLSYKTSAASWAITQVGSGNACTTFTITNAGAVQYATDNMGGTGYTGKIVFRAISIAQ